MSKTVVLAKNSLALGVVLVLVSGGVVGYVIRPSASGNHLAMISNQSVVDQRTDFVALANNIKAEMAKQGEI